MSEERSNPTAEDLEAIYREHGEHILRAVETADKRREEENRSLLDAIARASTAREGDKE